MTAAQLTYAAASSELATILTELESDRLDVDDVVAHVSRSAELIGVCRERISGAQLQVTEVLAALSTPS